jgi:hypothetical protein
LSLLIVPSQIDVVAAEREHALIGKVHGNEEYLDCQRSSFAAAAETHSKLRRVCRTPVPPSAMDELKDEMMANRMDGGDPHSRTK